MGDNHRVSSGDGYNRSIRMTNNYDYVRLEDGVKGEEGREKDGEEVEDDG